MRALCAALSEHVRLQPARGNPGLLLVDPPAAGDDPLQRSLSTLGIPDAAALDAIQVLLQGNTTATENFNKLLKALGDAKQGETPKASTALMSKT